MKKRKIIIDCDPGHDDAIALFLALGNKKIFDLLGISTVAGNQTIEKVTTNALNLVSVIDPEIPVHSGSGKPLKNKLRPAGDFHGKTGMDGPTFNKNDVTASSTDSVSWMAKVIKKSSEKVTIVAIGPLTNIAKLITKHQDIKENIEMISFMGGSLGSGNTTATAEFNIWQDPDAAEIVFKSGIKLVMSNLEATEKANLPWDYIDSLESSKSFKRLIWELMDFYGIFGRKINDEGAELHDALAIYYLLDKDKCITKKMYVDVETNIGKTFGETFSDTRRWSEEKPNMDVIVDFDKADFFNELKKSFDYLDQNVVGGKYGLMKK